MISNHRRSDFTWGWLVFLSTFAVFLLSPIRTVYDSNYSMLFSQQLLWHGSFSLDRQVFPELKEKYPGEVLIRGANLTYHLEPVGDRLYYYFPPGSSVLSMPYVALMNAIGISSIDQNGAYNQKAETKIQLTLAALLMAGLAVVVFSTGRLLLPVSWSVLVTAATTLGTQVWSTASRALWTDTWGILVMGFVIWQLLRCDIKGMPYRPVLLATCLAWLYFIRPTFFVPISTITVYVLLFRRSIFIPFALTGGVWLALFVWYSQFHFGHYLPSYYQDNASYLSLATFWKAMAGTLISPSRGLFVYVPVLVFVGYLLLRYRSSLVMPGFVVLALVTIAGHIAVISTFTAWQGGHCYGPRYTTSLVPWFTLLGILAVKTRLQWHDQNLEKDSTFRWRAEWIFGAILLLSSVTIHGVGAISQAAWRWNVLPANVDANPERIWDWKHPQFLAPLQKDRYRSY